MNTSQRANYRQKKGGGGWRGGSVNVNDKSAAFMCRYNHPIMTAMSRVGGLGVGADGGGVLQVGDGGYGTARTDRWNSGKQQQTYRQAF